jgi:hypothetical protein
MKTKDLLIVMGVVVGAFLVYKLWQGNRGRNGNGNGTGPFDASRQWGGGSGRPPSSTPPNQSQGGGMWDALANMVESTGSAAADIFG